MNKPKSLFETNEGDQTSLVDKQTTEDTTDNSEFCMDEKEHMVCVLPKGHSGPHRNTFKELSNSKFWGEATQDTSAIGRVEEIIKDLEKGYDVSDKRNVSALKAVLTLARVGKKMIDYKTTLSLFVGKKMIDTDKSLPWKQTEEKMPASSNERSLSCNSSSTCKHCGEKIWKGYLWINDNGSFCSANDDANKFHEPIPPNSSEEPPKIFDYQFCPHKVCEHGQNDHREGKCQVATCPCPGWNPTNKSNSSMSNEDILNNLKDIYGRYLDGELATAVEMAREIDRLIQGKPATNSAMPTPDQIIGKFYSWCHNYSMAEWEGEKEQFKDALKAFYQDIRNSFFLSMTDGGLAHGLTKEDAEAAAETVDDYFSNHYGK